MNSNRFDDLGRGLIHASSRRDLLRRFGVGAAGVALAPGLAAVSAKSGHGKGKGKGKGKGNKTNPLANIPVRGVNSDGKLAFKGRLTVEEFAQNATEDGVVASGTLTGKVKGGDQGNGWHDIDSVAVDNIPVALPNSTSASKANGRVSTAATCQILDLTLGPLDLTLLGLRIQLNQIHLQITAQQGGGLLGDLLCSLAGLLSGGGALSDIVGLLNQILGVLQGL